MNRQKEEGEDVRRKSCGKDDERCRTWRMRKSYKENGRGAGNIS